VPVPSATRCASTFLDVQPTDWFYDYVFYLYCHDGISGYTTNPPCAHGLPCFDPYATVTRGQTSKIVVLAFNLPINTAGGPHFSDVPIGSTFYNYVETLFNARVVSGYSDGTFRPSDEVTRAQLTKIIVLTAAVVDPSGWQLQNPPTATFEDVPAGSTFYRYIETALYHGVIDGYGCGTSPAGVCVPPDNNSYFVPNGNASRAQISKIAYLAAGQIR
jgi:peptidoglycan DL-endopeptidase CwlO